MQKRNIPLWILRGIILISTLIYVAYITTARGDMGYALKFRYATEIYAACLFEGVFFFVMADITGVFSEKREG